MQRKGSAISVERREEGIEGRQAESTHLWSLHPRPFSSPWLPREISPKAAAAARAALERCFCFRLSEEDNDVLSFLFGSSVF